MNRLTSRSMPRASQVHWKPETFLICIGTARAALDLAEVLGTSPKIWMNFQATYDLDRAMKARDAA
jgi:hypothetical protein